MTDSDKVSDAQIDAIYRGLVDAAGVSLSFPS